MIQWRSFFLTVLLSFAVLSLSLTEEITTPDFPCKPPHFNSYPFCNASLALSTRAQSLVSHLNLSEKITLLSNGAGAIQRLGIPPYQWWSESLHGIAANGPGVRFNGTVKSATSFPQVLVTAAAFNRSLWSEIAKAIGKEARAMFNVGQAGLTFWAPNINIFRDPRWGRGQETPGEDPVVAASYAVEYVKGFQWQGRDDEYIGKRALEESDTGGDLVLSACCKHFTAYDLEKWHNFSRYSFNAKVTKQDMEDSYQPPFRSCIQEGRASCLMCSYNQVNGVPACAHYDLLDQVRNEWGFKGYITSDCDAVAVIYEYQNYTRSPEDAVALVLKAGMDINCGTYLLRHTKGALEQGKVQEKDIDRALLNLFSVQLRLGLFDGDPLQHRYGKFGPADVCTEEHKKLALEAARQGIVLLKNENNFLPLKRSVVGSLAIIGPAANVSSKLRGLYSGMSKQYNFVLPSLFSLLPLTVAGNAGDPCRNKTLYDGLGAYIKSAYIKSALYAPGCLNVSCESSEGFLEAIHVAQGADYVVVIAGLDLDQESEDHDRVSLFLPGKQMELICAIADASKKPLVLVLIGGGPLDISFAKDDPRVASILWVGYPGEAGGQAVADVIFGEFNPGGRLPVTWYPESFTDVPMNDMNMRANSSRGYPGRTYRFYTGDIVYGFGHGLSYSKFSYQLLSAPRILDLDGSLVQADFGKKAAFERAAFEKAGPSDFIHVDEVASCTDLQFYVHISVTNNGNMHGSHVVFLFSRVDYRGAPQKQLVSFSRVHTKLNQTIEVSLLVDTCKHLSVVNEIGLRILPLGVHVLMLADLEHHLYIQV